MIAWLLAVVMGLLFWLGLARSQRAAEAREVRRAVEQVPELGGFADPRHTLAPAGYRLVWSDEFDGPGLDPAKWAHRDLGPRRDAINTVESVALDGRGHLVITTSRAGDSYHTGMIGTRGLFEATYGYFEVRARLQREVGHWSAFWMMPPRLGDPLGDTHAAGTEIDIFEYLRRNGDEVQHALHWDGYGEHHKSRGHVEAVPQLGEGWHVFGLHWTEDEYVFSVDGRETWRTGEAISRRDQYMILSCEVGRWAGDIAEAVLPDSLLVDYVRVYQRAK